MNSNLQTALDIKSYKNITNPFLFKFYVNSTSKQQTQLSISSHILKKISLIDFSLSQELADLYKQCLLDVIQSPVLDLSSAEVIEQILNFLQYWQQMLGKAASWPHTRTCFYFLEEKLKKNKQFQILDLVRLKRAQLQPNKKEFLNQIMAENIHSEKLRNYIKLLKSQNEESSENSLSISLSKHQNLQFSTNQNTISIQQEICDYEDSIKNILYRDSHQDWDVIAKKVKTLKNDNKTDNQDHIQKIKTQLADYLQMYVLQRLPVSLRQMKIQKKSKEEIIKELNFRKTVIEIMGFPQFIQILNIKICNLQYV